MGVSSPSRSVFAFDHFEVDPRAGELREHGLRIRLQQQPFQVLLCLLEEPAEVVTREQLRQKVWPEGTFVDFDHALNTAIKKIRCALRDHAGIPRYIETIPRRGYRFIAPVHTVHDSSSPRQTEIGDSSSGVMSRFLPGASPLRAALLVLLGALLIAATGYSFLGRRAPHAGLPAVRRVMLAVLPFQNLSRDPAENLLCDGLSEELTTQLSRADAGRLGVAAGTAAAQFGRRPASVAEIGRLLQVEYVLQGSVRRDRNRVRVSAQLIRVADQSHIWAADFDHPLGSPLALETDVALAITREVQARLLPPPLSASR